jgi:hypothetical protein
MVLGVWKIWLGVPKISLRILWSTFDKFGSTLNHSPTNGENDFFGELLVSKGIKATTYHSTICKTHVFSVYSHQYMDVATHLHTGNLDYPRTVLVHFKLRQNMMVE